MDMVSLNDSKHVIYVCCGKIMHMFCHKNLSASKHLNDNQKYSCLLCRAKNAVAGSKEEIRRLNNWVEKRKGWAQFMLGCRFRNGIGVKKDFLRALELYTLAADQGSAKARCNLGYMYANGNGVEQDDKRGLEFNTLATDQGHADAQCNLGHMYQNGQGVKKDEKRAVKLYTLAVEQGHAHAQCNLAYMYRNGIGVEKDTKRGLELYTLASEQGHADAQCNLGHMYQNGQGVEKDEKHAVKLYALAAEQDHAMAQNNLGWSYHNGYGVDQSYETAKELYEAATTTSGSQELHRSNLTFLIDQNNGTTPSHQKVREWYKKAVNNDAEYQYLMGLAYERGTGVIQSFPKSKKWYEKAASQGMANAQTRLDIISKTTKKKFKQQKPNSHCDCGSTKKYKKCCGSKKRV